MANKTLFHSERGSRTVNRAGGLAYRLEPRHALAQLAATGCFNGTYYADPASQLAELQSLAGQVDDNEFLAKLAVYSRRRAFMKDMPAALLLILSRRDTELFHRAFDRVVDNGRVLRTLMQMLRSGQFGRRSLSYSLQRAVQRWLNTASVSALLNASIGHDPSLRDVLRIARPTPVDDVRRAAFGWLTGKEPARWEPATEANLPDEVRDLIAFRSASDEGEQVAILERRRFRWDLLADSALGTEVWKAIARRMGHQALRMNLNTLRRHGVFADPEMVRFVAERIANDDEIRSARQFPYQYFAAYANADPDLPREIRTALESAAEVACGNVPELPGPVVVGLDVSGSMGCSVTGFRGRATPSKVRCVDAAAVFAAAILRRNPGSVIVPFDTSAHAVDVSPGERILSLSKRLSRFGGGGTNCSLPLAHANRALKKRAFVGCVMVSDNESWVGSGRHGNTATLTEWEAFVANQRRLQGDAVEPKLVCIDIQPYADTQAPERGDILNVGGFSDAVFTVAAGFLSGGADRFVGEVEATEV